MKVETAARPESVEMKREQKPEPEPGPPAPQPEPAAAGSSPGQAGDAQADAAHVSVVPGITRYHKSDCLLIRFLTAEDLEVMSRQAARDSGCVPCKACKPDQASADAAVS